MYYVVYLIESQQNVVLPINWVRDGENHLEKFVNRFTLNSNQTYLCFYTEEGDAWIDNEPNPNFLPNFNLEVDNVVFPMTGCYFGKLVKFKGILVLYTL